MSCSVYHIISNMSVKVAAEYLPKQACRVETAEKKVVVVREYEKREKLAVEELERQCEVGQQQQGKPSLFTNLMGDPLCRARHVPLHIMLVIFFNIINWIIIQLVFQYDYKK